MNRWIAGMAVLLCLALSGCDWMDGSYASVSPHMDVSSSEQGSNVFVSNYTELKNALVDLVENGTALGVLYTKDYDKNLLADDLDSAINYITQDHHLGNYAVETLKTEIGSNAGLSAVSVRIDYRHNRSEIQQIRQMHSMDEAKKYIYSMMDQCSTGLVMQVENYRETDYSQLIQVYADENPDKIMEMPTVVEHVYSDSGDTRVVELKFDYDTSRDSLKMMQMYVEPIFSAARLYVLGDEEDSVKYGHLISFLMERNDYQVRKSNTPTYSLLRHGVGDSKAFAMVYRAICANAGLQCMLVSGTKAGEPWYWNIICIDEQYYHLDLLGGYLQGNIQMTTDAQMQDYVWDYSAYPACDAVIPG